MHRKFHLSMRNNLFTVQVTVHWNRLPRGVVESISVEIFENHLDTILCHVLWDDPAGAGGLDYMSHSGPFQPDSLCESVNATGHWCPCNVHDYMRDPPVTALVDKDHLSL